MKNRILAAVISISLFATPKSANAQDNRCKDLQTERETAENKMKELTKRKAPMEYFISLMEDTKVSVSSVQEEIATSDQKIKELQGKITGGDKSGATAAELQAYRNRVELMKLRIGNTYSGSKFFGLPKYKEQEKLEAKIVVEETDIKREIARIAQDMITYNCPKVAKKSTDDMGDISIELESAWAGTWKYAENKMMMTMKLKGTANLISGDATFNVGRAGANDSKYILKDCKENGANKLGCSFTASLEDDEKYLDVKGTVALFLAGNNMTSIWTEVDKPTIRWKAGQEKAGGFIIRDPLRPYPLPFKKVTN